VASLDNMDDATAEQPLSHWKAPRVQGELPNCTMHNFNALPIAGRNVLVSSAYAAGTTVVDFTDPAKPVEVGHTTRTAPTCGRRTGTTATSTRTTAGAGST
jgi:hypothetical protein